MAERIPLTAVPNQTLAVMLGPQPCRINVRQRRTGLFIDLYIQDVPIALGVKAVDRTYLIRDDGSIFTGDLFFVDEQGEADPHFDGLGSRWQLAWGPNA